MRRLLRTWGPEGYGRYWLLMEELGCNGGEIGASTDDDWETACEVMRYGPEDSTAAMEFVGDLAKFGLLDAKALGDGVISSERMMRNIDDADRYHKKRVEAGKKGGRGRKKEEEQEDPCSDK